MESHLPTHTPWNVHEEDFPWSGSASERLQFVLNFAALAPSSHNTQPWRFAVDVDDEILVYADKSRWLRVADADQRELHISIGCALENLCIALEHYGYRANVDYFPESGNEYLIARVRVTGEPRLPAPDAEDLFEEISRRNTNHHLFERAPIPQAHLDALVACATGEEIALLLTSDEQIRAKVDELVVHSDAVQFSRHEFRDELAYWIGQGVFGTPWLMSLLGKLATEYVNLGTITAKRDSYVLMSAPVLALLVSRDNDRVTQVRVGRVLERIYLTATLYGIAVRPMSQILEVAETRAGLVDVLSLGDLVPQQPFLLGYAAPMESHTPRKPVEALML